MVKNGGDMCDIEVGPIVVGKPLDTESLSTKIKVTAEQSFNNGYR